MLRWITTLTLALMAMMPAAGGSLRFSGTDNVVTVTGSEAEGYDAIYVIRSLAGVSMTYRASSPAATVGWMQFTDGGAAYATPVAGVTRNGADWVLSSPANQTGYVITEGASTLTVLIIDYSRYTLDLGGFRIANAGGSCGSLRAFCDNASEIPFYTKIATRRTLSRDLSLTYKALVADEETGSLTTIDKDIRLPYIPSTGALIDSPYQPTEFTLSGDRFYAAYNHGTAASASIHYADEMSVICAAKATQLNTSSDNVKSTAVTPGHFGGNAPVEMEFEAEVNDAATYIQWQVSSSSDFSTITYTYPYLQFSETFNAPGTTFVRFYASNDDNSCSQTGPTFIIDVGESALDCPNAFSPNDDGVNDIWKVSYRSLVEFDCHIFNRWGTEIHHFNDPSDGWDGTYGGKKVPAGVYYYVITAKGSDDKDYKLSGDINIINYR